MKGSANAAWITGRPRRRVRRKKYGDRVKNRRSGAPGGARAGQTARGTSIGASLLPKRRPALRSLAYARGEKKEAPPRASLTIGGDGARLERRRDRARERRQLDMGMGRSKRGADSTEIEPSHTRSFPRKRESSSAQVRRQPFCAGSPLSRGRTGK